MEDDIGSKTFEEVWIEMEKLHFKSNIYKVLAKIIWNEALNQAKWITDSRVEPQISAEIEELKV